MPHGVVSSTEVRTQTSNFGSNLSVYSLKSINNSELYNVDNNQLQIKSIELELGKSTNNNVLQEFQQQ
ncbi:hypothetical protein [Candidatus Tisiphia endosymbiont of Nedyus quadrimaculatus]|uniref:hypothetical protein n=1 Tax=Candidatus Tisiphia endosymbiont of Nedyus quadrimaculatus TaxID=3139332 RepID=UPI003977B36A